MNKLTYTRIGDYYIPDLQLSKQSKKPIGKYGRMRLQYLRGYRPALYSRLLLSEKLYSHLLEVDTAANTRLDLLLPQIAAAAGITEKMKAADQMMWVGLMNTVKAQVEEIILNELIYV